MPHREVTGPLTQRSWCMRTSCVAPSTWRPARRRSRSWPPERWRSSDFQSDRPVTEPSSPVTSLSRRTRGTKSARNTGGAGRNYTRSCGRGYRPRRRNPAVAAPWPYRAVSLGPPYVIGQVDLEKRCDVAPGRNRTPLGQSAIPNGYPFSRAWVEGWDTGSSTRSDTHPHPAPRRGDFRRGVWHEKTPPEPSVLAHAGFWDSGLCLVTATPSRKRPQASINAQRLSKKSVLK